MIQARATKYNLVVMMLAKNPQNSLWNELIHEGMNEVC